jgi:hypothetical protein
VKLNCFQNVTVCVFLCQELLSTVTALKADPKATLHPAQHIVNTLAGDAGEMTAKSLEAWYQDYVAKRREMGVTVVFKDMESTVAQWRLLVLVFAF